MDEASRRAQYLLRDFARRSNLLIATRPFVALPSGDPVAAELDRLARSIGALPDDASSTRRVEIDVTTGEARIGGVRLDRGASAADRLDFARAHMPISAEFGSRLAASGRARGLRIGVSMTLEPKTANLALLLRDAGADVTVYAHPDETDADVALALAAKGIDVHADASLSGAAEREAALRFLNGAGKGLDVLMDDGSHLIRLAHELMPHAVDRWIGATEETTSGLRPLRAMADAGLLRTGVVAVNDAPTKTLFDNRYGTAQSCVFAIADLLEAAGVLVDDQPAVVIGYGPVGQGVAAYARALGASVSVVEVDAVRALQAIHDGFAVGTLAELASGALLISATGVADTIGADALGQARAVAVAGGVPGEVALQGLEGLLSEVTDHVEALPGGTLVLDRGGCINVTAAEGNPIEIMDLSFATQIASLMQLLEQRPGIGVHQVAPQRAEEVATTAAALFGIELAAPAQPSPEEQASWHSPRYRAARSGEAS